MKKLLISASIAAVFGLTGCGGGETLDEVKQQTATEQPFARVVFDPAAGNMNFPNDFLMIPSGDFFDFTLNLPLGEAGAVASNPLFAANTLDGWSTQHPFLLNITLPTDANGKVLADIDPLTLASGLKIFEATQALEGSSAKCLTLAAELGAPGVPCELGRELTFGIGEDYIARYAGDGTIQVVPLKPMKAGQGHMLVVTEDLKDTNGSPIKGSSTWELTRQDINTLPLSSSSQLRLQGLVNSLVNVLQPAGLERDNVSYAAYFTTQSTHEVIGTAKQLQIAPFAIALQTALAQGADMATARQMAAQYLPVIVANTPGAGTNAMETLGLVTDQAVAGAVQLGISQLPPAAAQLIPLIETTDFSALKTCNGIFGTLGGQMAPIWGPVNDFAVGVARGIAGQAGPFCAAKRKVGSINLPYYLSTTNPTGDWWRAACTNGAMISLLRRSDNAQVQGLFAALDSGDPEVLAGLAASGKVGANNGLCMQATANAAVRLFDLNLKAFGMDDPRNLTKFSPIPARQGSNTDNSDTAYSEAGTETINVQFTVPDVAIQNALAAQTGGAVAPISMPENGWPVLILQHGITGNKEQMLALTAAMSMAGIATVAIDHPLHGERAIGQANASANVGAYMNLQSLLTARDNLRQSITDTLGLRLGLNAVVDLSGEIKLDANNVSFLGMSLGAISGYGTVAQANTSLGGDLAAFDGMYAIKSMVSNVGAGGIAGFLLESPALSSTIKGSLLAANSAEFKAAFEASGLDIGSFYTAYHDSLTDAERAANQSLFNTFVFAAQTILDSADPVGYAGVVAANSTPTLMQLVVGGGTNDDGSTALPDQVNPITTSYPLYGGAPLATLTGLAPVSSTTEGSGVVNYLAGDHGTLLSPAASAATTSAMQTQAAAYVLSGGTNIMIADESLVQN